LDTPSIEYFFVKDDDRGMPEAVDLSSDELR